MRVVASILQLLVFTVGATQDKLPADSDVITNTDAAQIEGLLTRWGVKYEKYLHSNTWVVSDGGASALLWPAGYDSSQRVVALRLMSSLELRKPLSATDINEANGYDWTAKCHTRLDGTVVFIDVLDVADGVRAAKLRSFIKFFCGNFCRPLQGWGEQDGDWWNPLDGPRPFPQADLPLDRVIDHLTQDDVEVVVAHKGWQYTGHEALGYSGPWAEPLTVDGSNLWITFIAREPNKSREGTGVQLWEGVRKLDKDAADRLAKKFNADHRDSAVQRMPNGSQTLIAKIDLSKGLTLGAFLQRVEGFAKDAKDLASLLPPAPAH